VASNIVLSKVEYTVVGKRPVRPDGVDKVTGRAQYGADLQLTGLLHAKVLRSPHPHARIKSIDITRAEAHQGVISHAIGVRMQKLPINPGSIMEAQGQNRS
jgi:xanthine dehydrogenase molybdopterin-binding subunit B